jgi:hypothetical protein
MDAVTVSALKTAGLSEEDQAKVIAAIENATTAPGVGTVLRNPMSGDVALYVRQYGETYWRIYSTDDRTWIEQEPLVGWDVLHEAAAVVTTPGDAAVDPVEAAEPAAPAAKTTKK